MKLTILPEKQLVTRSSTPGRAMPAAEGRTKPTFADTAPSNAASSSTTQNGSIFSNPQASSTTLKFGTPPIFEYTPKHKQSGATLGNAGSSSTIKNESFFSKPPSFGELPKFGTSSIFGSNSESNQTHTPPPSNIFGSHPVFKQAPDSTLGSKGPSPGTPPRRSPN